MTKKTPEQRIAELDAKKKKLEDKLKAERAAITQAKRREQAKILNQKRKNETRKKILVGSMYLERCQGDSEKTARLTRSLDSYLTRDDDRRLFGLPTKPKTENHQPQDQDQDQDQVTDSIITD